MTDIRTRIATIRTQLESDTQGHNAHVILDQGEFVHARSAENGLMLYAFEVTTWPHHLALTGDLGTYVFKLHSEREVLPFFRGNISPGYWAEKLELGEHNEYSPDAAREYIREHSKDILDSLEGHEHQEFAEKLNELFDEVEDEDNAMTSLWNFDEHELDFLDAYADDFYRPTDEFLRALICINNLAKFVTEQRASAASK